MVSYSIRTLPPPTWTALVVKTPFVVYTSSSEYVCGLSAWDVAPMRYNFDDESVEPAVFFVSCVVIVEVEPSAFVIVIVDEQPQQTTQPEQAQETAQGQTTETNVQPEQGTVETEQGVSIDLNAKTGDTLYRCYAIDERVLF